ncbi:MAG: DUF1015 domain-containing protein [Vagococcus sp.]
MVHIQAFKAIRPNEHLVEKIATLPYDVLNSEEAYLLGKDNPYSFLHVDKAEIDLAPELSPYDQLVYDTAAKNLNQFLHNNWLQKESHPALYLYELTMDGRSQLGLVACTSIEDYVNGNIKKHEFTREEKELDRINHIDACDANTSPIFLTYKENPDIAYIKYHWLSHHSPIYDFCSFHHVRHRVWLIDDEQIITQLEHLFTQYIPTLYIADGHHRTESAVKVGQKRITQHGNNQDAEYQRFLSVLFPKEELYIYDYNRILTMPLPANFMTQLETYFMVEVILDEQLSPQSSTQFSMYLDNSWYRLTLKEGFITQHPTLLDTLNTSIFQTYICSTILGITDSRTDTRIDFIGGIKGINELKSLVDSQSATVGFALFPTKMDDLLAVADANQIMPPKSTWFEPKLLSGLFLHDLESD